MGRDPRFILPGSLQHVVDVVFQNHFLFCPSEVVNDRFLGVLGRAQKAYAMPICAVVVLSSHYHLLLRPADGAHLASFMCFLKTNLAKEIGGRIRGWRGHFFDHRYHSTTVSDEAEAQVQVLRYVLSNGTKEFLVDRVQEWPGVHCATALIEGTSMTGTWFDRTAEYNARLRGPNDEDDADGATGDGDPESFSSVESVCFSPLPCWEHLRPEAWRRAVKEMVDLIDEEASIASAQTGKSSLGRARILATDPFSKPDRVKRSPKPRFHAVDEQVLAAMYKVVLEVFRLFYEAS